MTADKTEAVASEHRIDVADGGEQVRNVRCIILHPSWDSESKNYENHMERRMRVVRVIFPIK